MTYTQAFLEPAIHECLYHGAETVNLAPEVWVVLVKLKMKYEIISLVMWQLNIVYF